MRIYVNSYSSCVYIRQKVPSAIWTRDLFSPFPIWIENIPANFDNKYLYYSSISLLCYCLSTEPSPLYDNNHYHEECLRCNSCGINLSGKNQKRARRFKNQILCDLHFADVALMESSDFMQQLRSFKPQSLGCAVARRKSSTTLIFPLPPQACSGTLLYWRWISI